MAWILNPDKSAPQHMRYIPDPNFVEMTPTAVLLRQCGYKMGDPDWGLIRSLTWASVASGKYLDGNVGIRWGLIEHAPRVADAIRETYCFYISKEEIYWGLRSEVPPDGHPIPSVPHELTATFLMKMMKGK